MPLFGSHRDVACEKCHPKSVFNLPFPKPDSCGNAGCHVSPHQGHLFGTRPCEWCHSPTFKTLKQQNFDHTEKTRFDLGPAHKQIKCYDCHTKALGEGKPTGACEVCHAKDNKHEDRFKEFGDPPRCGTCHPSGGPKFTPSVFNHGGRTRFKLEGKHLQIACRACHRGKDPVRLRELPGPDRQSRQGRLQGLSPAREGPRRRRSPERQVQELAVPAVPRERRQPQDQAGQGQRDPRRGARAAGYVPAGQGAREGEGAVRGLPRRPRQGGQGVVRGAQAELQRRRPVPRGLAAPGHARRQVPRLPHRRARGTRHEVRSQQAVPRRRQGRGQGVRAQGRAPHEQVRSSVTRSASSPRRTRRAAPRAATKTTTRTEAGSATSASSATSRPATTSSTTTR